MSTKVGPNNDSGIIMVDMPTSPSGAPSTRDETIGNLSQANLKIQREQEETQRNLRGLAKVFGVGGASLLAFTILARPEDYIFPLAGVSFSIYSVGIEIYRNQLKNNPQDTILPA